MKISVLICTRNRPDDLAWALPSILRNRGVEYEVVVVDQSDGEATAQIVKSHQAQHPCLRYFPTTSRGLSRARNLAITQASGDLMLFTDDDCETGPDWVAHAASLFDEDAALDLVLRTGASAGTFGRPDPCGAMSALR